MADVPKIPDVQQTLLLLERMRCGDDQAFADLYRIYHDELLFAVRQQMGPRLRSVLQSEDVLQSVALEAFRDLDKFDHRGKGSLRGYLHKMVLNKIRDRGEFFSAKKRNHAVPLSDSLLERTPAVGTEALRYHDDARFDRLERCMELLPDEMREAIILRRIDGLSSKEVAVRKNSSDAAVRKLYSRAVARLSMLMREPPA